MRLLLVEDDAVLGRGLVVNLTTEGFRVDWAKDLDEARAFVVDRGIELVVLDLNLPSGSGLSILKEMRKSGDDRPVVILTARSDEDSVVEGLNSGANDYIKKPFGQKELLARIRAAARLRAPVTQETCFGGFRVVHDQRRIYFGEQEVELNRREYEILAYFVRHGDSVVTRDSLLGLLGDDGEIFDRTVDSHISHIRARLKSAGVQGIRISSVYGVGYRLELRSQERSSDGAVKGT